ncbi:hypothetical protein [Nocardia rhamnosiphila]
MEDFEQRYRWYLDLLRDEPAIDPSELQAVERQIRRLNHDFEHADLTPEHRLEVIKLRNEAMTKVMAAQHHARIDDARAAGRAVADQLQRDRRLRQLRLDHDQRRGTDRSRDR